MNIENTLVLSTSHVPEHASNDSLGDLNSCVRVETHEYGWMVFIGGVDWDDICNEKFAKDIAWFKSIFDLAQRHGCAYIDFDCDAGSVSGLTTFS